VAIRLEDKQQIVSEVSAAAKSALSAVIADYRGVTVTDLTALRKAARSNGPTILALSKEDPGAAARVLKDFAKGNDKFNVKALAIGGRMLPADQIDVLASLPTYDQAIATLMSLMLAPVTKLARTLNEVPTKVTRCVAAVRDKKQAA
jgi:large subunit ribosomal protein L10